jgi:hypothetical protein
MDDTDLRLDGNAAAGLLDEILAAEATLVDGTCAHCGTTGPLGSAMVYAHAPGTVLRCAACDEVVLRVVRLRDRLLVDVAGVVRLEVPAAA